MDRREFLKHGGRGIAVATLLGPALYLSPAEAWQKELPLKVLSEAQMWTLEAAADTLLPGAAEAGVAYYIDEQLSRHANDSLLMAQYLNVPPPHRDFYTAAALALDNYARDMKDKTFADLSHKERDTLIGSLFPEQPEAWRGPPSQPVYLCLRADAVDVVYGTIPGYEKLEVPYLPHIEPPRGW